jgi:AAA+ ATPase superfamily predicted ATPase
LVKGKGQTKKDYLSVLGILTISQEALTEGQIANFVGMDKEKVRRLLTSLLQLLDTDESIPATKRTYSIYHRPFSEFLVDANRAEDYLCGEIYKNHQRIIKNYRTQALSWDKVDWSKVDWSKVDDYGLHHLASHLYLSINNTQDKRKDANKYRQELYEVICRVLKPEKFSQDEEFEIYNLVFSLRRKTVETKWVVHEIDKITAMIYFGIIILLLFWLHFSPKVF